MKQSYGVIFAVITSVIFLASTGGRNDRRAAAFGASESSCGSCHGGGSTDGGVTLIGLPSEYTPGQKYNLTLQVDDANAVRAGLQMVVNDGITGDMIGSFTAGGNTRVVTSGSGAGRLSQSAPKNFTSGSALFSFCWTAPTTGSLDDVIFNWSVVAANGNGSTSGDAVYTGNSGEIALPVEFVSLSSDLIDQQVKINWTTATEINNDRFVIERSLTGLDFQEIGYVKAIGNSSQLRDYYFIDRDPPLNKSILYRIKQVDNDGLYTYSNAISTEVVTVTNTTLIDHFPNPVRVGGCMFLDYVTATDIDLLSVSLFDAMGREVIGAKDLYNSSLVKGAHNFMFETNGLQQGMYYLRVLEDGQQTYSEPIMIVQ